MKLYYDLHIHSALSPCGDKDMTPNNIVNMAYIKGLDVIAVTDHNSCGNVRAVQRVAEDRIMVIPGMEIETSEEVHILGLFPHIEAAEEMESIIKGCSCPIKNRPEIFGNQYYMDENDEIIGEEERLLVTATGLDIYAAVESILRLGGVPVAAHIDRESYSVLSNLGFIPPDLNIGTVEITSANRGSMMGEYADYIVLTSSDAHYLGDISERSFFAECPKRESREFLSKICKNL